MILYLLIEKIISFLRKVFREFLLKQKIVKIKIKDYIIKYFKNYVILY